VYRALATTWPFQVRRHELGSLAGRYSAAHQRILKAGFTSQHVTDAISSELKPSIASITWATLSRSQRKTEWLRLCLSAVKRLERRLVELKAQRRAEEESLHSIESASFQKSRPSLPAKSKADSHAEDLRTKKRNGRNRARRLAASAGKMTKPSTAISSTLRKEHDHILGMHSAKRRYQRGTATPGNVRKVMVELPFVDSQVRRRGQPTVRIRRLRVSEAVEQKHVAARNSGRPAFRIRRLSVNEATETKHLETCLAAITERTQQHTKRQQLRSQRRMKLMCTRMEWHRQCQEKAVASDELWQEAQETQYSIPQQGDVWAWPRLAQRQRELLVDEVEAFVRGGR
jgi:hypothetical protein